MDLPVISLCQNSKKGVKLPLLQSALSMLDKPRNQTMFDEGIVLGCMKACISDKGGRLQDFYSPQPFQSVSFTTIVGGFVGSKSQNRSSISIDILDFIDRAALLPNSDCFFHHLISNREEFLSKSSTSSPGKSSTKTATSELDKKIEKQFPTVSPPLNQATTSSLEGSKQSYAEVAKAAVPLPKSSEPAFEYKHPSKLSEERCEVRKEHRNKYNSYPYRKQFKERKTNPYVNKFTNAEANSCSVPSERKTSYYPSERNYRSETRFSQQVQTNPAASCRHPSSRNRRVQQRNSWEKSGPRRNNCVDKVNWRTGEPINDKMGINAESSFNSPGGQSYLCQPVKENPGCDLKKKNDVDECPNTSFGVSSEMETQPPLAEIHRRSLSSECSVDSEDSIVFQSSGGLASSESYDWSDYDSDNSCDSDSESRVEFDICDGTMEGPPHDILEINKQWLNNSISDVDDSTSLLESPRKTKQVCFSTSAPKVHVMIAWEFAYRNSRIGPWEEMARDRDRFQCRIARMEHIIAPVLSAEHRAKVWSRFAES